MLFAWPEERLACKQKLNVYLGQLATKYLFMKVLRVTSVLYLLFVSVMLLYIFFAISICRFTIVDILCLN